MSNKDLIVPNIGDFKDVEVIEVLINEGDNIKKNDPLITIESDKSSVEIPSIYSGKIEKLNLKVGDKVSEGSSIATISAKDEIVENIKEDKKLENKKETISQPEINKIEIEEKKPGSIKLASPKARKFARELGIDVSEISGSERLGRVVESDIKKFAAIKINNPNEIQKKKTEKKIQIQYAHSEFGEVEVKDIPRIKRIAAPHLVNSWSSIPHVTNHDEADITEMEEFRNSLTDIYSGQRKKITPLAFIIKALVTSLKNFPNFNSSIDDIEVGKITLKKYFHIGIAVDTPNGLMVPKIRNANNKNIDQISKELKQVSEDCRNLKIDKKEFFGGSMTITSLGGIGGSFFTPIINYPEVAILGVGRSYKKQIYIKDRFETRTVLPLSLSYDHRIIDGAEAARFNNDIKENLGRNFAYKLAV
tara:strand:+ start:2927 stop:4183 length:1257 start_codon:yes stop_codon:yes gene_type:complete